MLNDIKQVIVVRTDLNMSTGKIAAEVAHAAVNASELARKNAYEWWKMWIESGQKKIVLKIEGEDRLMELYKKACALNLPAALIYDAGYTEIPPNTLTCLGIGPAPSNLIDKITGQLPLLK
ncbi:MAG: peptidyl-tRNA hydrolase Pth2 [archaeon YNP-WB-062]|jgi:PTH2 family peptidyl-tRNA hydrolase|nr:peptidyl-tRNA hydrolase Pth2 [Candidatus Culexarchaeum yellowstonense]MCS7367096.1 peptidyl-tRNA hydrolase Pth2 [Candidatus Culexarchaeum yellowstonense]